MKTYHKTECTNCYEGFFHWYETEEISSCDNCETQLTLDDYLKDYWDKQYSGD